MKRVIFLVNIFKINMNQENVLNCASFENYLQFFFKSRYVTRNANQISVILKIHYSARAG